MVTQLVSMKMMKIVIVRTYTLENFDILIHCCLKQFIFFLKFINHTPWKRVFLLLFCLWILIKAVTWISNIKRSIFSFSLSLSSPNIIRMIYQSKNIKLQMHIRMLQLHCLIHVSSQSDLFTLITNNFLKIYP